MGMGGRIEGWRKDLAHAARALRLATAFVVLLGVMVGTTACGAPRQLNAAPGEGGSRPQNITREEIASLSEGDAFSIIQQRRALWLRPRIVGTFRTDASGRAVYPEIFVDGLWYGPFRTLRDFRSVDIERIEFISALDATTLYGTGYMGGIIRVVIRR